MAAEQIALAAGAAALRLLNQRDEERVYLALFAVVCVYGDIYIVILGHEVYMIRQRNRAHNAVVHIRTRGMGAAAGGNLDDTVRFCRGKPFEYRVYRFHIGYIESGIGVMIFRCIFQHLLVLFKIDNGHTDTSFSETTFIIIS